MSSPLEREWREELGRIRALAAIALQSRRRKPTRQALAEIHQIAHVAIEDPKAGRSDAH